MMQLDTQPYFHHPDLPLTEMGCRSPHLCPTLMQVRLFALPSAPESGWWNILADLRPGVREAPAAYLGPGSVDPPFLFSLQEVLCAMQSHSTPRLQLIC